jgi:hypothetical protein
MKKTLIALMGLMAASSAQASIIYLFQSVTPVGSSFDWKYTAQLSADQKINTATSPAFAVVFDFLGATSASTSSVVAGLTVSTVLENLTASQPFAQSVADSASIPNIRTILTGTFSASANTVLYTIDIVSTVGSNGQHFIMQSAEALKNAPGDPADNSVTGNTALIAGPSASTSTPEPATTALLGLGLVGAGLFRASRKRV